MLLDRLPPGGTPVATSGVAMEPLLQFCLKHGSAGDGASGSATVKEEPGEAGAAALAEAAKGEAPPVAVKLESGDADIAAAADAALKCVVPAASAGASAAAAPAPAPGGADFALQSRFSEVLKHCFSWRPDLKPVIQECIAWRKGSDGNPKPCAPWNSVCPSDLRLLATQLQKVSWFKGMGEGGFVAALDRENAVLRLYKAMSRFKKAKKQPFEAQPVLGKARQHEAKEYERSSKMQSRDTSADDARMSSKRRQFYTQMIRKSIGIMDKASQETQPPEPDSANPLQRQMSGRTTSETQKYWELLDIMRPYKNFTLKYVNGPLRKWKEESEHGLLTELDPVKRTRYEKHVQISTAIGKMFRRLQLLCDDDPKDFKVPPNLQQLLKINETLKTVIDRCSASGLHHIQKPPDVHHLGRPEPPKPKPRPRPRPKPKPRNLEPRDPAILAKRPQLSYDPSQLTWNRQNMFTKKDSRNLEQKYCYCGEHKPNEPTVMCAECNHWFHISCCDQVCCRSPPAAAAPAPAPARARAPAAVL